MLNVSVTSTSGRSFEFCCDSASAFGNTLVARFNSSESPESNSALSLLRQERGMVVGCECSTDQTLIVAHVKKCNVDFSTTLDQVF